jgi:hypothetical protein
MRQCPLEAFTMVSQNQSCFFSAGVSSTKNLLSELCAFAAMMWFRFSLPPGISGA